MAIQIKHLVAQSLLKLCETAPLSTITVQQILDDTGISRQTFYNHFKDKYALIQYIYDTYIIPDFQLQQMTTINFYEILVTSFQRMQTYHSFLKQACLMDGQNCLKDYIYRHCEAFDIQWHEALYGKQPLPQTLYFATKYHANASTNMTLSWILSDMPVSCEELAKLIVQMRALGMDVLFKDCALPNPYCK